LYPVNVFHWSSFVSSRVWRNNAVPQCYINTTFTTNGWTIKTGGIVLFVWVFLKLFWLDLRSYLQVKKENELCLYEKWAKGGQKIWNVTCIQNYFFFILMNFIFLIVYWDLTVICLLFSSVSYSFWDELNQIIRM
jgi:hypothetical protein